MAPPENLPPPSLMVRKFLNYDAAAHAAKDAEDAALASAPFERGYCSFYGSLMDPETLSRVLNLATPDSLKMRRARVLGYQIKLWGPYPALVDGEPNQSVYGVMCEISSEAHMDRLAAYETDKYSLEYCFIELLNDENGSVEKTVSGVSFMWDGEEGELRPGTFDLREWKKEKGLRSLPSLEGDGKLD